MFAKSDRNLVFMSKVIEGNYRARKIELSEPTAGIAEGTPVLVTFMEPLSVDLLSLGIDSAQAAEARARLMTFAEEWDSPEMSIYDDYDAARSQQDS